MNKTPTTSVMSVYPAGRIGDYLYSFVHLRNSVDAEFLPLSFRMQWLASDVMPSSRITVAA